MHNLNLKWELLNEGLIEDLIAYCFVEIFLIMVWKVVVDFGMNKI